MTRFDKTRLPHTSNSLTLTACNITTQYAIDLPFSQNSFITLCNNRSKCESDSVLLYRVMSSKVTNLNVCGSLVLSNPVTYYDIIQWYGDAVWWYDVIID